MSDDLIPLSFRSYDADGFVHRHGHVQFVLPVVGALEMEVGGLGGFVDLAQAAFVPPETDHDQYSPRDNRILIVECDAADVGEAAVERLTRDPFLTISPAARRLIEFIDMTRTGAAVTDAVAGHGVPLLLDALLSPAEGPGRLGAMLRKVEAAPGEAWTASRMAREAGVSASRLHALFRQELATTPQAWLTDLRLKLVREGLATTDRSIAQLAFEAGYADQSALTRAMRRATGETPSAWRKRHRR